MSRPNIGRFDVAGAVCFLNSVAFCYWLRHRSHR
jgi:hypothetical protein